MTIRAYCEGAGGLRFDERRKGRGNYDYKLSSTFGLELHDPAARDLVRFGLGAFLTDRAFRRAIPLGQRTRQLRVVIPVEEPERWTALSPHVVRFADFVSQDRWVFEFELLKYRAKTGATMPAPENAAVHLFSDGLDSLCGLAAALQREENPILVSHIPPGRDDVAGKWRALRKALKLPDQRVLHVTVKMAVSDKDEKGMRRLFPERSRRTRPLFYLSLAGAVALQLRVPNVNLNENGVLAVSLPWSLDRTGWDITRHAHPETLRRFEQVLRLSLAISTRGAECA